MLETVALTEDILSRYPHLLGPTQAHATEMAAVLDALWSNLEGLVNNPKPYLTK
jgi:alpha-D-ribose 1-methylphosphonate 5-triphosphate synthase subunit PhnG